MSVNQQYYSIQGGVVAARDDLALTGSYVATTAVDMGSYDSVLCVIKVGTAQAGKTCNVKFQWSYDNGTSFADETVDTPGLALVGTPGTQPFDPYIRVVNVPMDTAGYTYICRNRRMGHQFRISVKSDGVTTGTVSVIILKTNNYN